MLENPESRARLRRKLEGWKQPGNPLTVNQGLELLGLVDRLEKEADWLAKKLVRNAILHDLSEAHLDGADERINHIVNNAYQIWAWREAAHKAVEAQK